MRWTIADATTFNTVQQGTISDPTLSYFFPSIAVNAIGDVVVGFSGSNSSTFASTYALVGTSAGGVAGGSLTFGSPVQTKAGTDFYPDTRWGDYSAVTPDPADPGIFWRIKNTRRTGLPSAARPTATGPLKPAKSFPQNWVSGAGQYGGRKLRHGQQLFHSSRTGRIRSHHLQ